MYTYFAFVLVFEYANALSVHTGSLTPLISCFIIHQIFFVHAIGLNTSRDAAKTGEYQMIIIPKFSNSAIYIRKFSFYP